MALETPSSVTIAAAATAPPAAEDDPLWYKDAIIYQAHVKSFFDSNNDGIGDFGGLTEKLDYLQGLGVTCIWILPFFPSPLKDDGYDIADYRNVNPAYGTLDDFRRFVNAAHDRRIKVLIELVVNHTSDQHPWFLRARHAPPGSPEREFYVWSDTDRKFPETRIIFLDTEKSNWTYDPIAGQYYWHRFFSHQPDLNHNNPAVVDAVIDVMKFWLDIGVDALRLDAVPYLCVREGTSNENLPETHAVLRKMRRELDAAYKNRMLLAEANQWPADVRPYFGEGDECHMAFHFPLMPRMFMALRQEDRHAIVEILTQTPDIPDTAQWALFLRNHDELTLEMVTDEERDYMYQAYAADPQMRLNLGIRRRLAPLVENSRRRIELLAALLFSMRGTPIVYYGDEIGMGDNIYLGDRNGVRTPMQWSGDRNGGFSRADPARLFAPPIMDPVYGYQSVNVEAQERSPFSLLNWTRRLIAMRRQHRVFGRGSLEFVGCPNRKVLAYLRRDDRETILCVVNLSRTLQPAPLDLKAFAGLTPVEMVGQTEFPRIADEPYFLTLGPYGSYWFTLQQTGVQMTPRATAPADAAEVLVESLPSLLVGVDWEGVLDSATRQVLERQALAPFLKRQRWFASKSRELRQARFTDWAPLRKGRTPAFLTIISVEYSDGWTESYFVPLTLTTGEPAERWLKQVPGSVLARITGARKGVVADSMLDEDASDRMLDVILGSRETASQKGSVAGSVPERIELTGEHKWTRGGGDQSNSVAFVNDCLALKVFRRIEPGPNPELEIGRLLRTRGFMRVAPLAGALEYRRPSLEPGTLAILQGIVRNQGTAWEYSIEELRRYFERVDARVSTAGGADDQLAFNAESEPGPFFSALEEWYLSSAGLLGKRTAELHLALADPASASFAPEPFGGGQRDELAVRMRATATTALDALGRRVDAMAEAAQPLARRVLEARSVILDRLDAVRVPRQAGLRTRVHGDYHLGQVLRIEEDFVILDFEGEPARPLAERRAKHSPLKDVAGMTRSFSYAAHAALLAFTAHAPDSFACLEPWADAWQYWAADAFLKGYRQTIGGAPIVPPGDEFTSLLNAFVLEKAMYELAYELDNRPDWVRIPMAGIIKIVTGGR